MTAPAKAGRPSRPSPPPRRVVAAGPRRAAKVRAQRSQRRRRWLRRSAVPLAAGTPVLVLAWLVLLSPVLGVSTVEVAGTQRLAVEQVLAAAAVEDGTPLARVDIGAVAARVEEALPPAADVRVRRVWPTTLRLQVTERTPMAGIAREDGVLLVDADGVGFATEPAMPPGVPSLELASPGGDDPTSRAALAVLAELPESLRGSLAVLRATGPADVQLLLADGRTVLWGAPGDAATKSAALAVLLSREGTEFDVSAPGIVVRR